MSALATWTTWKRRTAQAVIPAIAGLVAVGAGATLPSAQAAVRSPARQGVPGLVGSARVALGSTSSIFTNHFTQAPDGTVFYSRGLVLYAQKTTAAPTVALHVGHPVQALAANATDLFVQTGRTVTEYSRTGGAFVRHWILTSPHAITIAQLIVVGQTLWSETDWGTDQSGAEPAIVSRIDTTTTTVHVVDRKANYGPLAADATGAYFDDVVNTITENLVHVTPTGSVHRHAAKANAPMALAGGRLDVLIFHSGHLSIDTYSPTSLLRLTSAVVSSRDVAIAATGVGLLVLSVPCSHLTCSASTVSELATDGSVSGTLAVPDAFSLDLLTGPSAAVVEYVSGHMYLVRISA